MTVASPALLEARELSFSYDGKRDVLKSVSLALNKGEFVGVLGPNGAGKSTLLRCLLRILSPHSGDVTCQGTSLSHLSRLALAQQLSYVPSSIDLEFAFTVRDVVAMGRTPYLGAFRPEGAEDQRAVSAALAATDLTHLESRSFRELSDGEARRVLLARAIAQETNVMLLDEPNANLDLKHAQELMRMIRTKTTNGAGVLASLHDINLASRSCDRLVLLSKGTVYASGKPGDVLTADNIYSVFDVRARIVDEDRDRPMVLVE